MALNIDRPYAVHRNGTALTDDLDHLRDMIEEVLMTLPGERVNRPDFGAGLGRYLFEGIRPDDVHSLETLVRASLAQWLGDVIVVSGVTVAPGADGRLTIDVAWFPILSPAAAQTTTLPR